MLDLQAAAKSYLAESRRPFTHDRSRTIGSSEIGQCARKIWFEKKIGPQGYDASYNPASGAAHRGDLLEEHYTRQVVRHALKKLGNGATLIWDGESQHTIEAIEWRLSSTPDGLIVMPHNVPRDALKKFGIDDCLTPSIVVEMKSYDPRIVGQLPKPEHVTQLNTQLGLIKKEGTYDPMFGVLMYVNASFPDEIKDFAFPFDRVVFEASIRRALHIMGAQHELHLRPEGKIAGGKECGHCPFAGRCLGHIPMIPQESPHFVKLPKPQQTALGKLVVAHKKTSAEIEELETDKRSLEEDITEILHDHKTQRTFGKLSNGDQFQVAWEFSDGRQILDRTALDEALAKVGLKYKDVTRKSRATERLKITVLPKT